MTWASYDDPVSGSESNSATIRSAYANWISRNCPTLAPAADALSLAIFPWPDEALAAPVVDALVGELNPAANLPHPNVREVAADRLLRMIDSLLQLDSADLSDSFHAAAEKLVNLPPLSYRDISASFSILGPLLGIRNVALGTSSTAPMAYRSPLEQNERLPGQHESLKQKLGFELKPEDLARILYRVAQSEAHDLGVLIDGEPMDIDLTTIARACPDLEVLNDLYAQIAQLPDREADIYIARFGSTTSEAQTLDALGARWGITRERVRQIASKQAAHLDERLGEKLTSLAQVLLKPLREKIVPAELLSSLILMITPNGEDANVALAAMLRAEGGEWRFDNRWISTSDGWRQFGDAQEALTETAGADRSVSQQAANAHLDKHFINQIQLEDFVASQLGWVAVSDRWALTGSKRNIVATALRSIGRPATKAEIAAVAGVEEVNLVGSQLSSIEGIVRADKDRWAYAEWVDDPYDGIVGEINQRIEQNGGQVSVAQLVTELPARFGVSIASVRTYLATDAFVVDKGMVSRNESDYVASNPAKQTGAFWDGDHWGQLVLLHQRHFEGYSLAVNFDIAFANGIRPGDDLLVPLDDADGYKVSVIWQRHNPSRTVFIGRLSEALASRGCSAGDEVILVPRANGIAIINDLENSAMEQVPAPSDLRIGDSSVLDGAEAELLPSSNDAKDPLLNLLGDQ